MITKRHMIQRAILPVCLVILSFQSLSQAENSQNSSVQISDIRNAVAEKVITDIQEIQGSALNKIFHCRFFSVQIGLNGRSVIYDGSQISLLDALNTTIRLDRLADCIKPGIIMQNVGDILELKEALDAIYPTSIPISEMNKIKELGPIRRQGNSWIILRGTFFKEFAGFVVNTNELGKITEMQYVLGLKI